MITVMCSDESYVTNLLLSFAGFYQILQFQLELCQYDALTQYAEEAYNSAYNIKNADSVTTQSKKSMYITHARNYSCLSCQSWMAFCRLWMAPGSFGALDGLQTSLDGFRWSNVLWVAPESRQHPRGLRTAFSRTMSVCSFSKLTYKTSVSFSFRNINQ